MIALKHEGFWWRTMGLTRTHLVGVFVTETTFCLLGVFLALAAAIVSHDRAILLLLGAVCTILISISVVLSSILSLLFYFGMDEPVRTDQYGASPGRPANPGWVTTSVDDSSSGHER